MAKDKTRGGAADWLADRALRALIALALALPHRARLRLMGSVLRRVIGPLAGYRRRAMANLAYVHPDWSEKKRRRTADARS